MAHSSKAPEQATRGKKTAATAGHVSHVRKLNHLKDEVYREMLLLEVDRPGAEMGLALALLRAVVQGPTLPEQEEYREWLTVICPMGLHMIEVALEKSCRCKLDPSRIK